jgi:putative endonuclease
VSDARRSLGRAAEAAAADFLVRRGLRIVERNVRFAMGEIDLVARDGDTVVFVEVKARQAGWDEGPAAAVAWQKRRRLVRLAQLYLKWRHLGDARCRFDVVAVTVAASGVSEVRHLPAAFDTS